MEKTIEELLQHFDPASEEYKNILARLINRLILTDGRLGTALFDAVASLTPSLAIEAVALKRNGDTWQVYLRKRAADDTAYPGEWHAPGSVFRNKETARDVANRLENEFGAPITDFQEICRIEPDKEHLETRGTFHSIIFLVFLDGEPRLDERHQWHGVEDLPEKTVDHHREIIIPMAVAAAEMKNNHSRLIALGGKIPLSSF